MRKVPLNLFARLLLDSHAISLPLPRFVLGYVRLSRSSYVVGRVRSNSVSPFLRKGSFLQRYLLP